MSLQKLFDKAVFESLKHKDHQIPTRPYYGDGYEAPIKTDFEKRNVHSLEVNLNKRWGLTSICAFASSARLCFLQFRKEYQTNKKFTFEKALHNRTKMDAFDGNENIYYECKCQEIVSNTSERLPASYFNNTYFKELCSLNGNREDFIYSSKSRNPEKKGKEYLQFPLTCMGIDDERDYHQLHFDVKQLICHLIAIAKQKNNKTKHLQYIIFKPNQSIIDNEPDLKNLYTTLDDEILKIWSSPKIRNFCENYNIELCKPDLSIYIGKLHDSVYEDAFLKK